MKKVLNKILSEAQKSEKLLYKLQKEVQEQIERSGFNRDEPSTFFSNPTYETSDQHGGEKCVKRYGHKVWIYDCWVSSNRVPESKKGLMKDYRYPVRSVALWYTPYNYNTDICREPMRLTPQEMYKKAEKEKTLYEDHNIKVTMLRRNVIPLFHSVQWSHKIAHHEYVMYLKRNVPNKRQTQILKDIADAMVANSEKFRNGEIDIEHYRQTSKALLQEKVKWERKTEKWMEIFHADTLRTLFAKADHIINDWWYE